VRDVERRVVFHSYRLEREICSINTAEMYANHQHGKSLVEVEEGADVAISTRQFRSGDGAVGWAA
jgi:hypothetical protein